MMLKATTLVLVGGLLLAGCQASTSPGRGLGGGGDGILQGLSNGKSGILPAGENDPSLDWSDPCAVNLNAVVESLLVYYSQHNQLPASLSQLPAKSIEGQTVRTTCPATNLPYTYVPAGLQAPREIIPSGVRLILYDAQPAHFRTLHLSDGTREAVVKQKVRLGIVMVPPAKGVGMGFTSAGGVQLYVVPVEQNLLDLYLRGNQFIQVRPIPGG
jgi:hypothetical protein